MQENAKLTLLCSVHAFTEEMSEQFKQQKIVVTSVFGFIFVRLDQLNLANEIYYGKVGA